MCGGSRGGLRVAIKSGGYGAGVPPLPIPNREVKPSGADGTAMQCGRVGSRLLSKRIEARRFMLSLRAYSVPRFLCLISVLKDGQMIFSVRFKLFTYLLQIFF